MNPATTTGQQTRKHGTTSHHKKNQHASLTQNNKGKGGGGKSGAPKTTTSSVLISEADGLNPPFDPRMRRVGSPLNQTQNIKRGWIQTGPDQSETVGSTPYRVNFLYNPSELALGHSMDPNYTKSSAAPETVDPLDTWYTAPMGTLSIGLLYDRTYELFSKAAGKKTAHPTSLANTYGVFADVAAWYTYLHMYDEMPTKWTESLCVAPPQMVMSYLFLGPLMVYYGYVSSISPTYTHWSQDMVPMRCSLSVEFALIPKPLETVSSQGGDPRRTSGGEVAEHAPVATSTPGTSGSWAYDVHSIQSNIDNTFVTGGG